MNYDLILKSIIYEDYVVCVNYDIGGSKCLTKRNFSGVLMSAEWILFRVFI